MVNENGPKGLPSREAMPDSHPDKGLIQPSVEEVKKRHAANHPFSWTVSTSLLDRGFRKEGSGNADNTGGTTVGLSAAHNMRALSVTSLDSSNFSMADTPALQAFFGQPAGQQPGCGFPVAHWLVLMHMGTGISSRC